jgi:DeoR family transcriptional regulator, fructose operon transcriptional repressor
MEEKLLPVERRQEILKLITQNGAARVAELSEQFEVSEMTIHRDLRYLEKTGQVKKNYGGVVSTTKSRVELAFNNRLQANLSEKQAIGRAAARLVSDGDSILVDASTTCLAMVRELSNRENITVFSTGISPVLALINSPKIQLYSVGGYVIGDTMSFSGPAAVEFLSKIHVDKCFTGAAAVHAEHCITDPLLPEVEIKRKSAAAANEVIILADHTKFGRLSHFDVFSFEEVDLIVTNASPDDPTSEAILRAGVEIVFAENGTNGDHENNQVLMPV